MQRVKAMEALDICSPKFSFSQAVEGVKRESERMLCDVLLDQAVLPGVGNIIKNEAAALTRLSRYNLLCAVPTQKSQYLCHMVQLNGCFKPCLKYF